MATPDIASTVISIISLCLSILCIFKFLQSQYRRKFTYQCLVVIQIDSIAAAILRNIYNSDIPVIPTVAVVFCTDFVLYAILLVDLGTLKLFAGVDTRINTKIVNGFMYVQLLLYGIRIYWCTVYQLPSNIFNDPDISQTKASNGRDAQDFQIFSGVYLGNGTARLGTQVKKLPQIKEKAPVESATNFP
ncbi:hypothetical protein HDV06_004027 [Boothiomyces sp. JEL0866]|nr:hypothetical protein HDV06_004027 [Boothiomyces sp. JEL0866]